ncbi:S-layer homology domain-containing protein [Scytonema millei]|uniref:S-layer homology domain-containing protein n=1 Tax=Scytonema millei VB511283 TaxID=1245923 RepID=A0A9X5I7V9_9CYAN|nr:S-layer homology domain-containing protein [Scytonema millei]NHC38160.1 S-layer homology domain-containing protein [Scytonema millei VB511283]
MCIVKAATTTILLATLACCELSYKANANPVPIAQKQLGDRAMALKQNSATALEQVLQSRKFKASDLAQVSTLNDIQGSWAQSFIAGLVSRGIVQGFPDGSFRPDEPVTRAQFAAIVTKAFPQQSNRNAIAFADVPEYYWAKDAIQTAYQTGFLAGYPNNTFLPEQNIPRVQVLVALANGLNLSAKTESSTLLDTLYQDAAEIPDFARSPVAAATANRLVVNYPNKDVLHPNQTATRADVAAFIYQALANQGEMPQLRADDPIAEYVVGLQPATPPAASTPEPQPLTPEQVAKLRQQYRIEVTPLTALIRPSVPGGGSSVGSPTAYGAGWGSAFFGTSFQGRARDTSKSDGAASFGFGLGDASKAVGLEIAATAVDLYGNTFGDGTISFKLHRLLPANFGIAVGVENAIIWGETDGGSSLYGVVSKVFSLTEDAAKPFSKITTSVGLGGGRFRSEEDVEDGNDTVNVFGSMGLQATEQLSLIADWTGQDLNLGVSVVPFRSLPLVITPSLADVTGNAGDGVRFVLGVGYVGRF